VLVLDSSTVASGAARYAGRNAGSVGDIEAIEVAIRQSLLTTRLEASGIDAERAEALTKLRVRLKADRVTDEGLGGSGLANSIFGFGVAFLLYFSIVFYGQAILRGVLEEKTTRVAEVIVASVSPDVLLAGKVIGVGAVGLTQQLVWLLSSVGFYTQRAKIFGAMGIEGVPQVGLPSVEPFVLVALVLFFLLGYTLYASLFAAVGAMVGSQEEAQQAAQPVIMLLVFSIIFAQPILTNPNSRLAEIVSWVPFSAPIIMPMRMTATQVGAGEIIGSLLGVLLASVACVWVAARIYRVGLLMYGKRPGLGELMRWIKQS
jgi:ABC-2 type transport system permease protein